MKTLNKNRNSENEEYCNKEKNTFLINLRTEKDELKTIGYISKFQYIFLSEF